MSLSIAGNNLSSIAMTAAMCIARRESIVGTLALIDVVVGMQELFPRHFVAAIGNDLIGVHVRLRSGFPSAIRQAGNAR